MQEVVSEWVSSGESRSVFCARRGLALHVLNYWIGRDQDNVGSGFQEVKAPAVVESDSYVRLLYPDGRVLEFVGEGSMPHLRAVLSW
jgi:hypothetical protein